jgi:hypothetical protein
MPEFDVHASMEAQDYEGLAAIIQAGDPEAGVAAMRALGKLGDERATDLLKGQLHSKEVALRRMAARVLYQMLGADAAQALDNETVRHILRFRAPGEILSSATAVRLFLETLPVLEHNNPSLDVEHGDGSVVSGSPMEDYHPLTLRKAGTERSTISTVRRVLSFFESLRRDLDGWWTVGPMRGTAVISFRKGDRFGETLHELAIARIAPDIYLSLSTKCRYADWD